MIFSKHMYYGRHAAEHRSYILDNLRKGQFQPGASSCVHRSPIYMKSTIRPCS